MRSAIAFLVAPPLLLAGCSSSSSASQPFIDNLVVPSTATGANGTYTLAGTMTVHDDGALITRLHIDVAEVSIPDVILPEPVSQGTFPVEFIFLGAPGAVIDYDVSVIDANGAESTAVSESVMLQ